MAILERVRFAWGGNNLRLTKTDQFGIFCFGKSLFCGFSSFTQLYLSFSESTSATHLSLLYDFLILSCRLDRFQFFFAIRFAYDYEDAFINEYLFFKNSLEIYLNLNFNASELAEMKRC